MRLFELKNDDDAVSPVIGVILMVAITVILAAVIGTFVLGMGENINQNAQAGVSFSTSGNNVEVQLTSLGNVDSASDITAEGCGDTYTFGSVGDTGTFSCSTGEKITVIGTLDGSENVVSTYKYTG